MESAIRKKYGQDEQVEVKIDRLTGSISATLNGEAVNMTDLGRIAAQTAKQVMIQRLREAERGSIYEEFSGAQGDHHHRHRGSLRGRCPGREHRQDGRISAAERTDPRRGPSAGRANSGADSGRPRGAAPGQDRPEPQPSGFHPAAVRAGSAGGGRADHRDQGLGPRGGIPHEGGRFVDRHKSGRGGSLRRSARQPHQEHRRGAGRREDRTSCDGTNPRRF